MTDQTPADTTIVGTVSHTAQSLIRALPPTFLMLCLINVAFLHVAPTRELAGSSMAAATVAQRLFGARGELIVRLVVIAALYFWTKVSRTLLFWSAFILTRPLGATLGDLMDKPLANGGFAVKPPVQEFSVKVLHVSISVFNPIFGA